MSSVCNLRVIRTPEPQCDETGDPFIAVKDNEERVIWLWDEASESQAHDAIRHVCARAQLCSACPLFSRHLPTF